MLELFKLVIAILFKWLFVVTYSPYFKRSEASELTSVYEFPKQQNKSPQMQPLLLRALIHCMCLFLLTCTKKVGNSTGWLISHSI